MASDRTATVASIAVSRRHQRPPTTGATTPKAIKAPRGPTSAISRGTAREPIPTEKAPKLSSTPKTRAIRASGTIRARRVKAVTSTTALPTPITHAAAKATT